jgi:hypothetical protein
MLTLRLLGQPCSVPRVVESVANLQTRFGLELVATLARKRIAEKVTQEGVPFKAPVV